MMQYYHMTGLYKKAEKSNVKRSELS